MDESVGARFLKVMRSRCPKNNPQASGQMISESLNWTYNEHSFCSFVIVFMDRFCFPHYNNITGWWYTYPSEKYEFVSWDDDIPNWMESHKSHVPNHQPDYIYIWVGYCKYSYNMLQ